jgi:hypothetical protein
MKLALGLLTVLVSSSAFAGSVNMTCAKAKATYLANGRIYVQTNNTTVPVYGLSQDCPHYMYKNAYWVRATDTNVCVIGYRCEEIRD